MPMSDRGARYEAMKLLGTRRCARCDVVIDDGSYCASCAMHTVGNSTYVWRWTTGSVTPLTVTQTYTFIGSATKK